jgi:UDPglucose 6-dehydrogenase
MNEVANLCERTGANVDAVRRGMGTDRRIGSRFLFPGIGYGGSCFPKDVQALALTAEQNDYDFSILKAVMGVNKTQKSRLAEKVRSFFGDDLSGKHFALWGLAFKPNTDDIREAPALTLIEEILAAGGKITAFDPEAMENVQSQIGDKINYAKSMYDALDGADALLIATEWSEFRNPNFHQMEIRLREQFIFDGRNLYDPEQFDDKGWYYASIGRRTVMP